MADKKHQVWLIAVFALAAVVLVYRQWTYPPAVEFDNLKYIQLLSTAVSARNAAWVDKVEQAITERQDSGEMSRRERQHFDRVIELARQEKWPEADRACFAFAEAQLNRRRARPATAHDHDEHAHRPVANRPAAAAVAASGR